MTRACFAFVFYAVALVLIYAGFSVPGSEGINHHLMPRGDAEIFAALLIINGCAAKLMGHVCLLLNPRRSRGY